MPEIEPKTLVKFSLIGEAHPKGSLSPVPIPSLTGPYIHLATNKRVSVVAVESNKKVKPFMKSLAAEALAAFKGLKEKGLSPYCQYKAVELSDRPMILRTIVERLRPRGHFKADGVTLTKSAPLYPDTKPDMGKVIRAVEDALEGVIYTNDARIIRHSTEKTFGQVDRVTVEVLVLPKTAEEYQNWDEIDVVGATSW